MMPPFHWSGSLDAINVLNLISRIDLETKIQQLERQKIDDESHQQAEKEKMEDRIQSAMEAREAAEKDALVMK